MEIKYEKGGHFGNIMTVEAMAAKTDNFNKLMNRCWYGVAGTIFPEGMESFWEINWWDGDKRTGKKILSNQTITKTKGKWEVFCDTRAARTWIAPRRLLRAAPPHVHDGVNPTSCSCRSRPSGRMRTMA
jgi:hypothetical protein